MDFSPRGYEMLNLKAKSINKGSADYSNKKKVRHLSLLVLFGVGVVCDFGFFQPQL